MKIEKIWETDSHRGREESQPFLPKPHKFISVQMSEDKGYTYFTWNTRKDECLCFVSGERNCLTQVNHEDGHCDDHAD